MSNKMQYLIRQKETFASSSKTYQYFILNVYGINGINLICDLNLINPYQKPTRELA